MNVRIGSFAITDIATWRADLWEAGWIVRRLRPKRGTLGWKLLLWRRAPRKIGRLDMLMYRLFYWRWKPLLENDPKLLMLFKEWIDGWIAQQQPKDKA